MKGPDTAREMEIKFGKLRNLSSFISSASRTLSICPPPTPTASPPLNPSSTATLLTGSRSPGKAASFPLRWSGVVDGDSIHGGEERTRGPTKGRSWGKWGKRREWEEARRRTKEEWFRMDLGLGFRRMRDGIRVLMIAIDEHGWRSGRRVY